MQGKFLHEDTVRGVSEPSNKANAEKHQSLRRSHHDSFHEHIYLEETDQTISCMCACVLLYLID
jgi:hypothetical protein